MVKPDIGPNDTRPDPTFPANHAFVVQFRQGAEDTSKWFEGVIEHVVSGQTTTFISMEELTSFMVHVLKQEKLR